jgi:arginine:ornithine antiporter / lysine permease
MTSTETSAESTSGKVSLPTLTAMVIGSMIGSGVFLLPQRFGARTGVLGAIIAWTIAGAGMLMLAFVFQRLATRKPDLDAGIFAYAKAGFGDYVGFNSAFGYWGKSLVRDMTIAAVATFYTVFLIVAAGPDKLLLSCLLYAPGAILYVIARRERDLRLFRPPEAVLFAIIVVGAVAAIVSLASGAIEI